MSAYVTGAAISATSAALGYGANALRERGARRDAARAARSAALHQAMREYMAALDASMMEVEDFPMPPKMTALDRWVEDKLEGTLLDLARHILVRLLKRLVYGRRHDDLSDRLVAASARLRLVATPKVEALMREVEILARECPVGDPQLMERWKPLRERIQLEFKNTLDGTSPSRTGRLRAAVGVLLEAHADKEKAGDADQRHRPNNPGAEMQRPLERHNSHAERPAEKANEPVQQTHGQSLRRAVAWDSASRKDSEKGFGERPLRSLWLPVAVVVVWVFIGSIILLGNTVWRSVGLGLVVVGGIVGLLSMLTAATGGVARVTGNLASTAAVLGGVILAQKVGNPGAHSLRWEIGVVLSTSVMVTTIVLLSWLAVGAIARRFKHS